MKKLEKINSHYRENEAIAHKEILNEFKEIREENKISDKKADFFQYLALVFMLDSFALPFILDKTYMFLGVVLYVVSICVFVFGLIKTPRNIFIRQK